MTNRKTVDVGILGCGPAGLLAAEGALNATLDNDDVRIRVRVYSIRKKSEIHGAQYLHENVVMPDDKSDELICYYKMGTQAGYAEKVYGDAAAPVSWEHFSQGLHPGWPLVGIYDHLWARWSDVVVPANFTRGTTHLLDFARSQDLDVVISTIPAPFTCNNLNAHKFPHKSIWITDRAYPECPDNTIVYNGDPHDDWYRSAKLFGHESTEFMHPVEGAVRGMKVISTNCDCLQSLTRWALREPGERKAVVAPAGRWGRWERGVLVHHAYHDAQAAVRRYTSAVMPGAALTP